jgi:hypothetical protein
MLEVGSWGTEDGRGKKEVRGRKAEIGGQKLEAMEFGIGNAEN